MIKVSVMYPYVAGARFDHAYYRDRHMPMMKQWLGAACLYYDRGSDIRRAADTEFDLPLALPHRQRAKNFQLPSEMTSTEPSATTMAVWSSIA